MNRLKCTIQLLIVSCFLIGSYVSQAQTVIKPELKWANGLIGDGSLVQASNDHYLEEGEDGNIIHAAIFRGTLDFDPGVDSLKLSANTNTIYIWKCDKEGKFLWVKSINYEGSSPIGFPLYRLNALSVDQETGDMYLSGVFGDTTIDFDPGPGIVKLEPKINQLSERYAASVFILKLNASGDFQWVRKLEVYNGSGINASAISKHIHGEGKLIYFAGRSLPSLDYNTYETAAYDFDPGPGTANILPPHSSNPISYLLCLNDRGEFEWVKLIAENGKTYMNFTVHAMEVNNNSIFITGGFQGTVDVNPAPAVYNIVASQGTDWYLLKYTINGELEWARQSEGGVTVHEGIEKPSVLGNTDKLMELDKKGNVYLAIGHNGPFNFNKLMPYGGAATLINATYYPNSTSTTTALIRYNNNGDFGWIKQIGGRDTANRVERARLSVGEDGTLFLAGRYNNTIDVNPGGESFLLAENGPNNNYIAQYDTSGKFIWGGNLAQSVMSDSYAEIVGLRAVDSSTVYVSGIWYGAMDFGVDSESFVLTADGENSDAFVLKLKIALVDTTSNIDTTTSVYNPLLSLGVKVYPNPTVGMLDITSSRSLNNAAVTITNIAGQVVFKRAELIGDKFQFDLSALAAGTYIFELQEGNYRRTYKLAKK